MSAAVLITAALITSTAVGVLTFAASVALGLRALRRLAEDPS
jgi:hypothetical protein